MIFGFGDVYDVLLFIVLLGLQYFLASRKSIYWGAIVPLAFLISKIYIIITNGEHIYVQIMVLILGLAFLSGPWISGRKSVKEKQKKELRKIQVRDI